MKILITLALLMLTLTSCEVSWGNERYDVPWYYIAIPVTLFVIIILIISGYFIFKRTYICPKCEKEFKPTKWYNLLWTVHFCGSRLFKCPHCKRTSFCHPCFHKKKDNDSDTPKNENENEHSSEKTDK
ncbi:MAG: hypothetical protein IJW54_06805 [Clostridia bacterium]|nr:hypothetical protein [Clostridia bacterium]